MVTATIQHKDMVSPAVHETKGISTAAAGTIGHSNGAGSETYTKDFANGVQVGGGTLLTKAVIYSFIFPGTPTGSQGQVSTGTFSVVGLTTNDKIIMLWASVGTLLIVQARVSAADTLELTFYNPFAAVGTGGTGAPVSLIALRS